MQANLSLDNFYYFYLVLGIIVLGAAFLDHFGKVKEDEDRKRTATNHKIRK